MVLPVLDVPINRIFSPLGKAQGEQSMEIQTGEQSFKAGGVGLSKKPRDQTKNPFINRQILNTLPSTAFFTKNDNANKIDLARSSEGAELTHSNLES